MEVVYLDTFQAGLRWARSYYRSHPQLNRASFAKSFQNAEQTLKHFPFSGHPYEDTKNVYEYSLAGTSFSFLYVVGEGSIYVIDLRDQRGYRSHDALRQFGAELRAKYGISI